MGIKDDAEDYHDALKNFAGRTQYGRRSSKNLALLQYVVEIHSLMLSGLPRHKPETPPDARVMNAYSRTVARALPKALEAVGKSLINERQPFFDDSDDGDDSDDEFCRVAAERLKTLGTTIKSVPEKDLRPALIECINGMTDDMLEEFKRQSANSWT